MRDCDGVCEHHERNAPVREAKAREIFDCDATHLLKYSPSQLAAADQWFKNYSLAKLKARLTKYDKPTRDYILLMARCHYGSAETDEYLAQMGCYPQWLKRGKND